MTEKELRKLNRLELLELLLEQSKLNESLKQELEEQKNKNYATDSIRSLEKMISQMDAALDHANYIAESLQNISKEKPNSENKEIRNDKSVSVEHEKTVVTNKNLYGRIMYFFWQNEDALSSLPVDLQDDIKIKLRGILNDRK